MAVTFPKARTENLSDHAWVTQLTSKDGTYCVRNLVHSGQAILNENGFFARETQVVQMEYLDSVLGYHEVVIDGPFAVFFADDNGVHASAWFDRDSFGGYERQQSALQPTSVPIRRGITTADIERLRAELGLATDIGPSPQEDPPMTAPSSEAGKEPSSGSLLDQIVRECDDLACKARAADEEARKAFVDRGEDLLPDEDRAGPPGTECPECHSHRVLPLVYGYPSYKTRYEVRTGLLALGGCCISDNDPEWRCSTCHREWRSRTKREDRAISAIFSWIDKYYQLTAEEVVVPSDPWSVQRVTFLDLVLTQAFQEGAAAVRIELKGPRLYFVFKDRAKLMHCTRRALDFIDQLKIYILEEQPVPSPGRVGSFVKVMIRWRPAKVPVSITEAIWTGEDGQRHSGPALSFELSGLELAPVPAEAVLEAPPVAANAVSEPWSLCPYCGEKLRGLRAKQCFDCGMDWHDPENVVCRKRT